MRRARRRIAGLAVVGLLAGGLFGYFVRQVEGLPSSCDDVLRATEAGWLLRTRESVSAEPSGSGENPLTCTWRSSGGPRDETKRTVALSIVVGRHWLYGAGAAVDSVRSQARLWHSAVHPVSLADETVATARTDASGAQAYVGVRQGRISILVTYRTDDPDSAMAANLAELAAATALRGGPKE